MKSIMEEASSVIKAIEKGWIEAGKPQEFTIKVFEEATKNFLGITTKPAKIGIFFTEKAVPHVKATKQPRPTREDVNRQTQQLQKKNVPATAQPPKHQKSYEKAPNVELYQEKKMREVWAPEHVDFVKDWVKTTLQLMGKPANFNVETKNYYLKLNFSSPIMEDQEKDQFLFRNFAYLLMQSLRNKFKKNFRGFKIILSSH